MKRILSLLLLCCAVLMHAAKYDPQKLPNPNVGNPDNYIYDPGHYLTETQCKNINAKLIQLRAQTTCEGAVAILPSIGDDYTIEEYATELFQHWGIGKKDRDNGILLLVDMKNHKVRIETGYGIEGVLPDIACHNIIIQDFVPYMKRDDLGGAVLQSVSKICEALSDPAVAEELRSKLSDGELEDGEEIIGFMTNLVFGLMAFVFMMHLISVRKMSKYQRALYWKSKLPLYWIGAVFSFGKGLLFVVIVYILKRRARNHRKCSACGARMKKLSEDKDNERLSASQDLEERIGSVDYDVFECPKCGGEEIYAFPAKLTKYVKCEKCGTQAKYLAEDREITPPTWTKSGVRCHTFLCKYCGNRQDKNYKTPCKKRSTGVSAVIAGATMGAAGGGFSGGGGGGGFGGGSSGGGGASGGW